MTVEEAREILGEEEEKLTDEQITDLLATTEVLADLAIDKFFELYNKGGIKAVKAWTRKDSKRM